ncbi:ATP-binding protein [Salinispirillum sp. LH 10-3-1]|uniref:histidine kinase n=1 Tax=Salinispirillum sp. LH 10-3-1 TaxID=2952525 RepID=A0AB38YDQ1_9GAMM
MRSSLSRRLLQLALVPALVFALLITAFFAASQIWRANETFTRQIDAFTRAALPTIEAGLVLDDSVFLRQAAQDLLNAPYVRSVRILDPQGSVVIEQGADIPLPLLANVSLGQHRHEDDEWVRLEYPVLADTMRHRLEADTPTMLGWLVVDYSVNDLSLQNYRLIALGVVIALAGLAVIWLLALRLIQPIIQPFHQTIDTIRAIKDGHYSERVHLATSGELRRLGEGVNAMADSLQNAHRDMQQSVDQATQDLHQTLEALEIQNIQLSNARRQAQEASEAKTQFLANMSHEIRTPLNGVLGFARLLSKTDLTAKQRDYLHTIQRSSEGLMTIINDILDFLKLESGKLELERRRMNLREVIEDVMDLLGPMAQDKDLELVTIIYEDVPLQALGDPLRLRQVLTNLVSNAIKFTSAGHVAVRLMLEHADAQTVRVRVSVSDTGPGLTREQQKRLFNAFSQADASTSRKFGGTGLGLVICQRLIEQMRGHIGVESVQGEGATFWFTLDLDLEPATELANNELSNVTHTHLAGSHVLVFEQHELTRTALSHRLEQWGMVMHDLTVQSLEQALQSSEQRQRLAILTCSEQAAPLLNQIVDACRQHDIPVLLLTRHNEYEQPLVQLESKADAQAAKPLRYSRLYALCSELLGAPNPTLAPSEHLSNLPNILVVDDNTTNRKLLISLLGDYGITPVEAENGSVAMEQISQQGFDLVFMDIQMPVMDGLTATREIRRHEDTNQHLPVIALTAHALPEEQEELMRSGFDDYITKPIDEEQLLAALQRWTGKRLRALPQPSIESNTGGVTNDCTDSATSSDSLLDVPLALQRAGHKVPLAKDMFRGLLDQISSEKDLLPQLHEEKSHDALLERVHALHGVTRYCGTPILETAVRELELNLKRTECSKVPNALHDLLDAMTELELWCAEHDWEGLLEDASR